MEQKKRVIVGITVLFIVTTGLFFCLDTREKEEEQATLVLQELREEKKTTEITAQIDELQEKEDTQREKVEEDNAALSENNEIEKTRSPDFVYVHLCGAVRHPGVYQLEEGLRLSDLIVIAGGLSETAAADYINQAAVVQDATRIYIPSMQEIEQQEYSKGQEYSAKPEFSVTKNDEISKLVNINTATKEELMTLPGVGEAKANSIISYREENGKFWTIEEIMNITGIKEGVFQKFSHEITVD